ncbi:hypothetical protein [Halorubrum sp. SY-15]|uniref:hypothetical protein n=1 Tax=Halorubrum sp. SY-15 TaxID=3402277 RepID=UPI003EBCC800
MTRHRRELLSTVGVTLSTAVLGGVAGCLDTAAGDGPQGPTGTPATLSCADDDFVRLSPPVGDSIVTRTVETSSTSLELATEGTAETYGQSLRLVLRNAGDQPATTRGEHAYAIQRETAAGWRDVRGTTAETAPDLAGDPQTLAGGDTYSWSFELTEAGIAAASPGEAVDVCPPLGPGSHRFVYWGLPASPSVAVEFDLIG